MKILGNIKWYIEENGINKMADYGMFNTLEEAVAFIAENDIIIYQEKEVEGGYLIETADNKVMVKKTYVQEMPNYLI